MTHARAKALQPFVLSKLKAEDVTVTDRKACVTVLRQCVLGTGLVKAYLKLYR